jgi:sulfide:quinone oxidoreductase
MSTHFPFLILGGGSAGISVAARLCRAGEKGKVGIVEPSDAHFYQPLWTLVGAGAATREETRRAERDLIPNGAEWVHDAVAEIDAPGNAVTLKSGARITYDFLVVALGLMVDWDGVKGLRDNVGKNGICSNYSFDTVNSTWEAIRNFKGGDAVFTHPATPIKCGGAPQKIMYLAEEAFRRQNVREKSTVHFFSGEAGIFKVEKYKKALEVVIARKEIKATFKHNLIELRPDSREAIFQHIETKAEVVQKYDMIHVTPPQKPIAVLASSGLGNAAGWVDVDKSTMQHTKFPNVYALGDCSHLPTSKTGAAVRGQAPILVKNLLATSKGGAPTASYDGYTSCPLVTGYGSLILAEFDYDLNPKETFPFDQSKERWSMYQLKRHLLPMMYWNGMLKGKA